MNSKEYKLRAYRFKSKHPERHSMEVTRGADSDGGGWLTIRFDGGEISFSNLSGFEYLDWARELASMIVAACDAKCDIVGGVKRVK